MNRIEVLGTGFDAALHYLNQADHDALDLYLTATAALQGTGAMAGTDTVAADFATVYDEAAQGAVDAVASLTDALGSLGLAVSLTYSHHRLAEYASEPLPLGRHDLRAPTTRPGPTTTDTPDLAGHTWYDAPAATVPSSLGGDPGSLPGWADVVLDHVGGFVWPDAHTTRLRTAADAWQQLYTDLFDLPGVLHDAAASLRTERSPEIDTAAGYLEDTIEQLCQLALGAGTLATTCRTYADQVETQREAILDIVNALVRDTLLLEAAGGLLDVVTGAGGTAAATAAVTARIAEKAPAILRLVELVRDLLRGFTATLRAVAAAVDDIAVRLRRFTALRLAMRTERGAVDLTKHGKTLLELHEGGMGAHTIAKHVGKSLPFLRGRLASETAKPMVSTFYDLAVANRASRSVLRSEREAIERWLNGPRAYQLPLDRTFNRPVGMILKRSGEVLDGRTVHILLAKDNSMPEGYRIITSYVKP